jgi:hypothetical protein
MIRPKNMEMTFVKAANHVLYPLEVLRQPPCSVAKMMNKQTTSKQTRHEDLAI